jgi:hypothetical protein
VIGLPPLLVGAANVTRSFPVALLVGIGYTLMLTGAPGTCAGTTMFDCAEAAPVPTAFVAVTVQRYVLPLVRLLTVIGELVPVLDPGAPPLLLVQLAE